MGVLLTIVAIAVSGSAGVAAERRWPAVAVGWARRALVISLYTLIPFVVFFNLARTHINTDEAGGLVIGWVALLSASGIAWLVGTRLLRLERPAAGSLITATLIANSGYLGYPLVASLLGFDALGEAVVYDVVVSSPALLLLGFGTGAAFGTKVGEGFRDRLVAFFTRNPPLYAAVAGLLVPNSLAPDVLVDISRGFVIALLPIGFFAVGAVLAEEAGGAAGQRSARPSILRSAPRSCCGSWSRPGCCSCSRSPSSTSPGPTCCWRRCPAASTRSWSPTSTGSTRSSRHRPWRGPPRSPWWPS